MATPKIIKITITMFKTEYAIKSAGNVLPIRIPESDAKKMANISKITDPTASSQAAIVSPVSRRKQQNLACMLNLSIVVASILLCLYQINNINSLQSE